MAETAPPKPAFAPTRSLPLPGGAKLVFCSGVTALWRRKAAASPMC
jgi:hypothetical protein